MADPRALFPLLLRLLHSHMLLALMHCCLGLLLSLLLLPLLLHLRLSVQVLKYFQFFVFQFILASLLNAAHSLLELLSVFLDFCQVLLLLLKDAWKFLAFVELVIS